ncbi:MAG: fibronectin type III domain-containing protein [Eubacteriales bacterium]|nr:fibronectin type III domain-containing protein [Eubacteriales bacterium]
MKRTSLFISAAFAFLCACLTVPVSASAVTDGIDMEAGADIEEEFQSTEYVTDSDAFSDDAESVLPDMAAAEKETQEDYAISLDSDKIQLIYMIGADDGLYANGGVSVKNTGKKTLTLHVDGCKYFGFFSFKLKPGREILHEISLRNVPNLQGTYKDAVFHIYDDTGHIDMTLPVIVYVSSADKKLLEFDKEELDFGEVYEDDIPQTGLELVIKWTDEVSDRRDYGDAYLYWDSLEFDKYFTVKGNLFELETKESISVSVIPKIDLAAGKYESFLIAEQNIDEFSGNSQIHIKVKLTVLPSRPESPDLEVRTSGNKAVFAWNQPELAKGYQIYKYDSKEKKYKCYKTIAGGETLNYEKTLGYGKNASFKIRAFNTRKDGSRLYGPFGSVRKVKTAAAAPVVTSVSTNCRDALTIDWRRPAGAEGYQIFRSTEKNGTYTRLKTVTKGSVSTYKNKNLVKGKKYYYKVRSFRIGYDGKRIYSAFGNAVGKKV